jgi:choline kinase
VNAVILSAGRGRRLLPLTENRPKCLLSVCGQSILEWQVQTLSRCGIDRVTVVVGFGADLVEDILAAQNLPNTELRTLFNPRYDVSDNLISCWAARGEMDNDFLLINGDTLFEADIPLRVLASPSAPVAVAICSKRVYDADDMKVRCEGTALRQVGKGLAPDQTDGESIGMLLFRGRGPRLFREALERSVRNPQSARQWFLSVVDEMAREDLVTTVAVDGLQWAEIDYLRDLQTAEQMVSGWKRNAAFTAQRPDVWPG